METFEVVSRNGHHSVVATAADGKRRVLATYPTREGAEVFLGRLQQSTRPRIPPHAQAPFSPEMEHYVRPFYDLLEQMEALKGLGQGWAPIVSADAERRLIKLSRAVRDPSRPGSRARA